MNQTDNQQEKDTSVENNGKEEKSFTKWLKRLGVAGFLFFLIKGILWLVVGGALLRYVGCES